MAKVLACNIRATRVAVAPAARCPRAARAAAAAARAVRAAALVGAEVELERGCTLLEVRPTAL